MNQQTKNEVKSIINIWIMAKFKDSRARAKRLEYLRFMDRIAECADNDGFMNVEESGMDCDGVRYQGQLHSIPATRDAYRKLEDEIGEWADGPFYLNPVTPEEAKSIVYDSRDLALEAFEDGHPHILYG